jgi:hypothetical protein
MTFELAVIRATSPPETSKYPTTLAIMTDLELSLHQRPCGKAFEYLLFGSFPAERYISSLFHFISVKHASSVYLDLEYRKSWDAETKSVRAMSRIDGAEIIHHVVKYYIQYSNREYYYKRQSKIIKVSLFILTRSELTR